MTNAAKPNPFEQVKTDLDRAYEAQILDLESRVSRLERDFKLLSDAVVNPNISPSPTNGFSSGPERPTAMAFQGAPPLFLDRVVKDILWSTRTLLKSGLLKTVNSFRDVQYIRSHRLFDADFYAGQVGVSTTENSLLWHYVTLGYASGLSPSKRFNANKYLQFYQDVRDSGREPLAHFHRYGQKEHRICVPVEELSRDADKVAASLTTTDDQGIDTEVNLEERARHRWPTAENPAIDPNALGLYDVRPDDVVPLEATRGEKFLSQFKLLSSAPDWRGAVEFLNKLPGNLNLKRALDDEGVEVTIVIPVYGQLAYTLNCLHSLAIHPSKYSFEIIVGDDASQDASGTWLAQLDFITHKRNDSNLGFIRNCNGAGEQARGKYIILLNNDTRVVDGWLDELIDSFLAFPNAGVVGSKLYYPDGSLQEAGGIVWQDGSAWNYGRNDDPNRPRYSHARQVDYVSGCSLALATEVWRRLGGFDEVFMPAYCEDSDLCFRTKEIGLEVWMQPLSKIIHYEGKTSGSDLNTGVKSYQVTNSVTLFKRWKTTLASHRPNGESPWFERERNVSKRVLVIDATNPTPWADAGSVTTTQTIKMYQALGYKVHFVPQDNFLFEPKAVSALQRIGVECAYAPYESDFASYMRKYGSLFDVIQVFRFPVAEKILHALRLFAPQAPVIFNNMDLHFLRLQREAEIACDPKQVALVKDTKDRELSVVRAVDCTVVPSTVEKELLDMLTPSATVRIFPYITDLIGTSASWKDRQDIMFLGGFGHGPNGDAVEFFMEHLWPELSDRLPNARYLIVGAKPSDKIRAYANDRVIVPGMVENLAEWFDRTRVFAATLRYGAGVKGKVYTAMAHGVPVVATRIAAEGMDLTDGKHVIIADQARAQIEGIVRVYEHSDIWHALSEDGQDFIRRNNAFDAGLAFARQTVETAQACHSALNGYPTRTTATIR